jgi:enamine deaminase RidA (YjgF/YER057c/UK114 family)
LVTPDKTEQNESIGDKEDKLSEDYRGSWFHPGSPWNTVTNQNVDDQTDAAGARSMNTDSKDTILSGDGCRLATAEQRLSQLGIKLPTPPEPFGIYAEAVQTGNLLFLTGMLPTVGREAKFIGRLGAELDVETGRKAAYIAAINALAVARQHLGSLDEVTRIVRLGVAVATSGDVRPVAVEKLTLLKKRFQARDRKCPPKSRMSFIGHPSAMKFLRISRE